MEQTDLDTWEEFETELERLREMRVGLMDAGRGTVSNLIFRGEPDHSWHLETTLERQLSKPLSVAKYFRLVSVARPQIETFTNLRWDIPEYPEVVEWAREYSNFVSKQFPGYDFLVYLRHHGFPSPLLDWTRSPYVAAYFAFAESCSERAAIYVYLEHTGQGKSGSSGAPEIIKFGPYVRSHARHFLQQSEYTACGVFKNDEWWYAPHPDVFSAGSETQDQLWKFTVPTSERQKVLRTLDAHNLNAFSLFQNEEALLKTISLREIELREKDF